MKPSIVALNGNRVRFIERDPVFHTVSKRLEACLSIGRKVITAFWALTFLLICYEGSRKYVSWRVWLEWELHAVWGAYTICLSSHPLYLSSRAWGRSQWYRVTYGWIPEKKTNVSSSDHLLWFSVQVLFPLDHYIHLLIVVHWSLCYSGQCQPDLLAPYHLKQQGTIQAQNE